MHKNTNAMKKELNVKTNTLSNYEQNVLLPILIKGLEMKKGKQNAVTNKQMVRGLQSFGLKIDVRRVCKLISHIRTNDLIVGLMASTTGYYVTSNEQELKAYEKNLLDRETALRKVRLSMKRQRYTLFAKDSHKQVQLF